MKKIAIDAGHGMHTAGKRCTKAFDAKETREWTINDAVAKKVVSSLKKYDCEVIRTDDTTGITDVSLESRCKKANNFDADVFVSIHHNAATTNSASGVEVYCYKNPNSTTKKLRDTTYSELIKANNNKGNRADGTREANFYVLLHTKMPAILIENGYMSSKRDVELILSDDYQSKSAEGIVNGLVKFLNLKEKTKENIKKHNTFLVRIKVGSLNVRSGAGINYKINRTVKKGEAFTIVETKESNGVTWGRLKSGAGWISLHEKYVERV